MTQELTIVISFLALIISAGTAWLTLFHRGSIKMTRPTVIFFGPDGSRGPVKVFLRTLLYCSSQRGRVVESMYLKLRNKSSEKLFNIWVYGDEFLARGSGLFVGKEGVVCNHHFLLPKTTDSYIFESGNYTVEVYAQLVGARHPLLLASEKLPLEQGWAEKINTVDAGVYFDWCQDSNEYQPHIEKNPNAELNYELKKQINLRDKVI